MAGIKYDTNSVELIDNDARITDCDLKLNKLVAGNIVNYFAEKLAVQADKIRMNYA